MVSQSPEPPRALASPEDETLAIVSSLALELHPHLRSAPPLGLEAQLDRDFGLDSLGRVEAVHRLELAFNVRLPDRLFAEATTAADLARALSAAGLPIARPSSRVKSRSAPLAAASPPALMTLPQVLAWHAERHGERAHVFLSDGQSEAPAITYARLRDGARSVAAALAGQGLEPGARVALMLPTGEAFLSAFFGVLEAGGVPAPIYPPWRMADIEEHLRRQGRVLGKAGAAGLIASREILPFARMLRDLIGGPAFVLAAEALRAKAGTAAAPQVAARPDSLALVQFTSGSTADPKGVMLSHANILANIRGLARAIAATPADVYVSWLPLYHDMGLIAAWLACVDQAVPLVLMNPLSFLARPERWLWTLHRNRATITAAPNFAFELCLSIPEERLEGLDLGALRVAGCGSEPISPTTIRDFSARFAPYGFRPEALMPVYGLAESAAALTACPLGRAPWVDHVDRALFARTGEARPVSAAAPGAQAFVSCGFPLVGHEARVVDTAGREAGERREGRLQFRGPSATAGYFEAPDKTVELIQGDWLESGDLAYVAQGEVFVTGRTKDIVKRAGRNIHPADIEDAVAGLGGVERGAVLFGVTDPERGVERLVLAVETALAAPDRGPLVRAIQALAASHLQTALDEIFFLDPGEIPRTESGKVRRAALGQAYLERDRPAARATPRRQLARLVRAALAARLRRDFSAIMDRLYAAYWWTVIGLFGLVLWPSLPLLSLHRRWRLMHGASRLALRLLGHRLDIEAIGPRPDRHVVYVANHASYIDSLVLAAVLPGDLAFTAFRALAQDRLQGTFAARLGTLFVERFEPGEAVADTERAADAVRAGRPLVVFPEATAMRAPGLLDFRMGAFVVAAETGAVVIPITLRGTRSILRHDLRWFPRRGAVGVRIGPALSPKGRDFAAAVALKSAARAEILAHVGEPDLAAEAPQF
jgi:1-acyl-sn-glycerol-3-phosphate acyltransferase